MGKGGGRGKEKKHRNERTCSRVGMLGVQGLLRCIAYLPTRCADANAASPLSLSNWSVADAANINKEVIFIMMINNASLFFIISAFYALDRLPFRDEL